MKYRSICHEENFRFEHRTLEVPVNMYQCHYIAVPPLVLVVRIANCVKHCTQYRPGFRIQTERCSNDGGRSGSEGGKRKGYERGWNAEMLTSREGEGRGREPKRTARELKHPGNGPSGVPERSVVKAYSPYPRLFFTSLLPHHGVDSCVFSIFTTRVDLKQNRAERTPAKKRKFKSTFSERAVDSPSRGGVIG